jgi:CRISPR-associated endonuclease/helicase Cas3
MSGTYIAHTREDGAEQPLLDHLNGTAARAQEHAAFWGAGSFANACGSVHDVGKYSIAFQDRIRSKNIWVDHATAGGQLIYEAGQKSTLGVLAAYCVMGHHGGLPNGGSQKQRDRSDGTLYGRLEKPVENYGVYQKELPLPRIETFKSQWADGFDAAFFVRMIFSALVDADWLDTEEFCACGNAPRGGFDSLSALHERLAPHIERRLNPAGEMNALNERRNGLLKNCLSAAAQSPGLFTLTAPTGSGKTESVLAFALEHAIRNNKRRIIYVVPYNTIAEQNAKVFEDLLGSENVLCHNHHIYYDGDDEASLNKRHSVENWDYPIIVTSNVQFFESLFANKPSKCRKLHNIAHSVLIFDEAQMIPVPYLIPCVRAIKTLVTQYGCSAVLATATQSALNKFFLEHPPEKPLTAIEIAENPVALYHALRRTEIHKVDEPLTDDALIERLLARNQVLCIVNTRHHAQELFGSLRHYTPEGAFHLSTTMYPAHRKRVLETIRQQIKRGMSCRVISTSLVEAGVDLDFETVFREQAGLDSIVQAAGRCNREGKRKPEDSIVYVFTSAGHRPPRMMEANISAYGQIARRYDDLAGLDAIKAYFEQLLYNIGEEQLDQKKILPMFINGAKSGMSFPFADAAKAFRLIDDSAQQTVYVLHEAPELQKRLCSGERTRELFRKLGSYAVSLFERDIRVLDEPDAIERLDESVYLLKEAYYNGQMGVTLSPEGGQALYG